MLFNFSLSSDTSREIFESTYYDLENQRTVPTTHLSMEHPFAAIGGNISLSFKPRDCTTP